MKIITTCIFFTFACLVHAQKPANPGFRWGFFAGMVSQSLGIEPLDGKEPEETAVQAQRPKAGFTLGAMLEKNIWRGFAFEPGISFSLVKNKVNFRPGGTIIYPFSDLELPVHFTLTNQTKQLLPLHAKLRFGPRLGYNWAPDPGAGLKLYPGRLGIDLGLGVEIKLGDWKFCPEMLYSHDLNNLHNFEGSTVDFAVGRVVRDKLAFRVVFKK